MHALPLTYERALHVRRLRLRTKRLGYPVNAATNLALLGHAFEDCEFGRVMLQTDVLNTRMEAAIEKVGASREGVLRRHKRRADGTFRDSVVFSILADEWPDIRDRLKSRLQAPVA